MPEQQRLTLCDRKGNEGYKDGSGDRDREPDEGAPLPSELPEPHYYIPGQNQDSTEMCIKHRRAEQSRRQHYRHPGTPTQLAHSQQMRQCAGDQHAVHPCPARENDREWIKGPQNRGRQSNLEAEQFVPQSKHQPHTGHPENHGQGA